MTRDDCPKNEEEKHDQIVRWCQEQINNGSDFFFDPKLFRETLRVKSKEWDFPFEVRLGESILEMVSWCESMRLTPIHFWRLPAAVAQLFDSKFAFITFEGQVSTSATKCLLFCRRICETRGIDTGHGEAAKLFPVHVQ